MNKLSSGMIPICINCERVRDDSGYWKQVENSIKDHSLDHAVCPDCFKKLCPEFYDKSGRYCRI